MRIHVKVTPRSSRNAVLGLLSDGTLKVALTAAPVDGAANEALCTLLSKEYGVSKSSITIIKGKTSRNKLVEIR